MLDLEKRWLRLLIALLAGIIMGTLASFVSQKASAAPLPGSLVRVVLVSTN